MGVRYRIDGVLHEMQAAPKAIQNGVISRLKIMAGCAHVPQLQSPGKFLDAIGDFLHG